MQNTVNLLGYSIIAMQELVHFVLDRPAWVLAGHVHIVMCTRSCYSRGKYESHTAEYSGGHCTSQRFLCTHFSSNHLCTTLSMFMRLCGTSR